jgi:hypothetical protein
LSNSHAIHSPAIPYVDGRAAQPNIPQDELQQLRQVFEPLGTLGDLLEWGRGLTPPVVSPVVVTQDEYTHDVLIPYGAGRWLDFDTT